MASSSSPREHILLVRLSHLGDIVRALCVFHALRTSRPEAVIAWVVQSEFAELLRGLPGLDEVIVFDRGGGIGSWWHIRRELRRFAPTHAVDAQGNAKSAAIMMLSRARRRSGLHAKDWREPFAFVLNDPAPRAEQAVPHAMDRMRGLTRHLAPELLRSGAPDRSDPGMSDEERQRGDEAFVAWMPVRAASTGSVVLSLGNPGDVRSWPLEHWAGLARELEQDGVPHLLLSGPAEASLGRRLEEELPAGELRAHRVGQEGLRALAGFFGAAARSGARLVGSDSGPLHLAAACGMPVVCLAGPQSFLRTGPWPVPGRAPESPQDRAPHGVVLSANPPACAPCGKRRCFHERGAVCMSELSPRRVARALAVEA